MRVGVGLAAFAVGAFGIWHFAHSGAPSAAQVEPLLRTYLESQSKCQGTFDLQLDNVSVGPYVSQFGGWPVYADHVEKCEGKISGFADSHSTMTYDGGHDAENKIAAAFVRRSFTGRLEVYVPELFQAGQREMQQLLQKSFDNIKVN